METPSTYTEQATQPDLTDTTTLEASEPTNDHGELAHGQPQLHLSGELALLVFTDKSLRRQRDDDHDVGDEMIYGDNERLSVVGCKVLELAMDTLLFQERPTLTVAEIVERRNAILAGECTLNLGQGLTRRLRYDPSVLTAPTDETMRVVLHAYAGAIYLDHGMEKVEEWTREMIRKQRSRDEEKIPPGKRHKTVEVVQPQPQPQASASPLTRTPPPPSMPSSDLPHNQTRPLNPLSLARPHLPFMPLFNDAATRRGVRVEYEGELIGSAHAGRWKTRCIVNGIPMGEGEGITKKESREKASLEACYQMGWGPSA